MRMGTKKVLSLILAGVLAAGSLIVCGGGGTAATAADTETEAATATGGAKAEGDATADTTGAGSGGRKTLRVAMECMYVPHNWTQLDDSNGAVAITNSNEFTYGYDVMMAKKICEELGYDLGIVRLNWDSLILAVTAGQADYVVAEQSITFECSQAVDFTEPCYYTTIATLAKEGSKYADARSVADPTGATCTPQQNTIWYNTCLSQIQNTNVPAATVSVSDVFMSLNADECDLAVTDQPTDKGALITCPNFKMTEFGDDGADFQMMDEGISIGISLKKGGIELKDAINSVPTEMTKGNFSRITDEAIPVQSLAN